MNETVNHCERAFLTRVPCSSSQQCLVYPAMVVAVPGAGAGSASREEQCWQHVSPAALVPLTSISRAPNQTVLPSCFIALLSSSRFSSGRSVLALVGWHSLLLDKKGNRWQGSPQGHGEACAFQLPRKKTAFTFPVHLHGSRYCCSYTWSSHYISIC